MTSLSDTLTVGLVLVLLFGSIALYLYTRIQQAEQKISLLESILLDLKMSAEIKSYTELPAQQVFDLKETEIESEHNTTSYLPFSELDEDDVYPDAVIGGDGDKHKTDVSDNDTSSKIVDVESETNKDLSNISVNYESMTLKELQTLAKTRGITGAGSMKKTSIIEALKTSDHSTSVVPGSMSDSSFLETSSPFQSTPNEES